MCCPENTYVSESRRRRNLCRGVERVFHGDGVNIALPAAARNEYIGG